MTNILSTKKLTPDQKAILSGSGIRLRDYDAIQIIPSDFAFPRSMQNVIFTSQHTVGIVIDKARRLKLKRSGLKAFCVGAKTAAKLWENGIEVVHYESYAADLADYILEKQRGKQFDFFCGSLRRDTLPARFSDQGVAFREIQVYRTELVPQRWNEDFDAVIFYSPSGVRSFFKKNRFSNSTLAICIGTTTAAEVEKFIARPVHIAKKTTIESVLYKTKELLTAQIRKDD